MTHVLVTGGAGFIGSHLTDRLLAEGLGVTVLDNLATGLRARVSADATFVEGDVGDRRVVDEVFADQRFDAVFHIAGQASIRLSFAEPGFSDVKPGSGAIKMWPVSVCHHVSTTGQFL